jgi:copper(I)-binding protein
MRLPWGAVVAATTVAVLGCAGLVRAAVPQTIASGGGTGTSPPIVVTGAYVRQPAPPTDAAAAYFTVYNTTATDDRLLSVVSGAGATSVLHTLVDGRMTVTANGAVIPAHGKLVLSTGGGHVMIENLFGDLVPGQNVNLQLTFAHAGPIEVSAPVIALEAPAPTNAVAPPTTGATK